MRGSVPGAPQAVLERPPPRPCAHLPPQQLLQCLPVFLEKRKEKKGESKTRLQNSNQLLQEKANADALRQGARPGTRCRTARSAPCPACTPPGTRCGRTHGHGHTDTDSPPPPKTHTHTQSPDAVWRRCRGRAGRYQYLRAARSALCLPASRMQAAAAAWHCFSTAGSTSLSSGSAAGELGVGCRHRRSPAGRRFCPAPHAPSRDPKPRPARRRSSDRGRGRQRLPPAPSPTRGETRRGAGTDAAKASAGGGAGRPREGSERRGRPGTARGAVRACPHGHLRACTSTYVHVYPYVHAQTHVQEHLRMCAHTPVGVHVPPRARTNSYKHAHPDADAHTHARGSVYTHTPTCMQTSLCAHTPTRMHGRFRARTPPPPHTRRYARTPRPHAHTRPYPRHTARGRPRRPHAAPRRPLPLTHAAAGLQHASEGGTEQRGVGAAGQAPGVAQQPAAALRVRRQLHCGAVTFDTRPRDRRR